MVTARERVIDALEHRQPDRVPVDLGSTAVTGIMASALHRLRHALGLEHRLVRVHEPYQVLGQVDDDVLDALGVDVIGLSEDNTMFGFPAADWQPFTLNDGTPVLVPGGFNTSPAPDGTLYQYPRGDRSAPPSARMPPEGYYHDALERQAQDAEKNLRPEEWVREMYSVYTDKELATLQKRPRRFPARRSARSSATLGLQDSGISPTFPAWPSPTRTEFGPSPTGTWPLRSTRNTSTVSLISSSRSHSRIWSCTIKRLATGLSRYF